jgi:hypothetical protein
LTTTSPVERKRYSPGSAGWYESKSGWQPDLLAGRRLQNDAFGGARPRDSAVELPLFDDVAGVVDFRNASQHMHPE